MTRAQAGDREAYRSLLDNLGPEVMAYLRRRLHNPQDVDDVYQEVLLAIHMSRHTYERGLPVTAWVRAIARYKLIDCLRASGHDVRTIPLDDAEIAVDDTAQIEAGIVVRQGVAALPETLRVPIQAVKLDGDSPRDLARLVQIGIEHPDIRFEIVYGVSGNKRSWYDNSNARRLGYNPQDDSEPNAAEILASETSSTDPRAELYQGGSFVSAEIGGDPSRPPPKLKSRKR